VAPPAHGCEAADLSSNITLVLILAGLAIGELLMAFSDGGFRELRLLLRGAGEPA
jgi:hypothetical protein